MYGAGQLRNAVEKSPQTTQVNDPPYTIKVKKIMFNNVLRKGRKRLLYLNTFVVQQVVPSIDRPGPNGLPATRGRSASSARPRDAKGRRTRPRKKTWGSSTPEGETGGCGGGAT